MTAHCKLEMRSKAYRIARSAPQCRPLSITVLTPGERRYTNPIADRRSLYTVDFRALGKNWSEAHQIYIRCSLIIAAVNAHIQIVIF